jgi:hypothetical protein
MKWSLYVEFRTGHNQDSWNKLAREEQIAAYRATGKQRKVAKAQIVEEDGGEFVIFQTFAFPVRLVSPKELISMPVFELY